MGWNTSAIILNDAVHMFEEDPDVGKKIAAAVRELHIRSPVDICIGNHVNAMTVIETHHADTIAPLLIGANMGQVIDGCHFHWSRDHENWDRELLTLLAKKHGYVLHKKR